MGFDGILTTIRPTVFIVSQFVVSLNLKPEVTMKNVLGGMLTMVVLAVCSGLAFAEEDSALQEGMIVCESKTIEVLSSAGAETGKFIQVGNCQISCSGGTTSTNCQPNEICNCECRSSGLPGCSCHPRVVDEDNQRVQNNIPSEDGLALVSSRQRHHTAK